MGRGGGEEVVLGMVSGVKPALCQKHFLHVSLLLIMMQISQVLLDKMSVNYAFIHGKHAEQSATVD